MTTYFPPTWPNLANQLVHQFWSSCLARFGWTLAYSTFWTPSSILSVHAVEMFFLVVSWSWGNHYPQDSHKMENVQHFGADSFPTSIYYWNPYRWWLDWLDLPFRFLTPHSQRRSTAPKALVCCQHDAVDERHLRNEIGITEIWRFPKIGVPLNHPFSSGIGVASSYWGTTIYMESPI